MKIVMQRWLHGLISALVTGIASSFLSALGITSADMLGMDIPNLTWRQLLVITIMGGLVGMAAYIKKSPLFKWEETDAQNETKTNDPTQ